ncbi:MAG: hypothetical protein HN969_04255 [Verrucomicrobia bacterium]|jgi:hypothetical protein|nr:hypothetical protein [Verrucomicrobiota bacterium]MBT3914223.1 hypothetical protein [Verrucomicrobiota bacterium]MBT7026759.1 hypothetical protein [Verrucomicrobiota bacterium]MBT7911167.1 hypothetical protein [Verrucomicrobiota bacterium]
MKYYISQIAGAATLPGNAKLQRLAERASIRAEKELSRKKRFNRQLELEEKLKDADFYRNRGEILADRPSVRSATIEDFMPKSKREVA